MAVKHCDRILAMAYALYTIASSSTSARDDGRIRDCYVWLGIDTKEIATDMFKLLVWLLQLYHGVSNSSIEGSAHLSRVNVWWRLDLHCPDIAANSIVNGDVRPLSLLEKISKNPVGCNTEWGLVHAI